MKDGQWSFNEHDSDYWNHDEYDTRDEAIAAAKEELEELVFDIGQMSLIPLPTTIDMDGLLEDLSENYSENIEDYNGDLFDDVTAKQKLELENELIEVLQNFYERVGIKSNYFTVDNVEVIDLTETQEAST